MKIRNRHIPVLHGLSVAVTLALVTVAMLSSCSTTRRIPDGEQLYVGLKKVEISGYDKEKVPEGVASQLNEAVADAPNNAIFKSPYYRWPFPVGLWVYNNWDNPPKGLKHKLYEKLVAQPVLVSDVRPNLRAKMMDEILDNNGYFRGHADYEVIDQKNPKKAKISYKVLTGPAYTLDSIGLLPDTCRLNHLIDSIASRDPYLRPGVRYSTDSLSAVRTRVANKLRSRGYYFFKPEFIEYLADSVAKPLSIDLRMALASNVAKPLLQCYTVGDVTVRVFRNKGGGTPDTIQTSRGTLIQMMPSRLRQKLIPECVTLRKGRVFSVRSMNSTQTRFARLGIFNAININVLPDSGQVLNVDIDCTFDTPLEATVELNASSKSNSYIGPGMKVGITNRNIFGGGEQFNVTLAGSYEWQTGKGSSSVFNSYEYGISTSLSVPRLLAPGFIKRRNRNLNWTRFTLNFEMLNRPHYFKMAQFNFSFNYDWQSSRYSSHTLTHHRGVRFNHRRQSGHSVEFPESVYPAAFLHLHLRPSV